MIPACLGGPDQGFRRAVPRAAAVCLCTQTHGAGLLAEGQVLSLWDFHDNTLLALPLYVSRLPHGGRQVQHGQECHRLAPRPVQLLCEDEGELLKSNLVTPY